MKDLVNEYEADLICISESWNRENLPLSNLLDIEGYKLYMNPKQRCQRGGSPGILVNEKNSL